MIFFNVAQFIPVMCLINMSPNKNWLQISAKTTKYLINIINTSFHRNDWYENNIYS